MKFNVPIAKQGIMPFGPDFKSYRVSVRGKAYLSEKTWDEVREILLNAKNPSENTLNVLIRMPMSDEEKRERMKPYLNPKG